MSDEMKDNITDSGIWLRALFMLIFGAIFCVIRLLLGAVIIGQFLWVLFTAGRNDKLLEFANQLAAYVYQIYRYLSFNTEQRPFPFDDFPSTATLEAVDAPMKDVEATVESETPPEDRQEPSIKPDEDHAAVDESADNEASNESAGQDAQADAQSDTTSDKTVDAASESGIENEDEKRS